jgi:hypothetical protein
VALLCLIIPRKPTSGPLAFMSTRPSSFWLLMRSNRSKSQRCPIEEIERDKR